MNEKDFKTKIIYRRRKREEIPVNDKRRFNADGEKLNFEEKKTQKIPSNRRGKSNLENRLREETTRREAAEAKLVGVQAKFEEVKTRWNAKHRKCADGCRKLWKTAQNKVSLIF